MCRATCILAPTSPPGIHQVTVIIGAGVLSLPKAFSMLGWLFGPLLLILFGAVSTWTSFMLSDVFDTDGKKHGTYKVKPMPCTSGVHNPQL